ncbi:sterol desaturase family protein [Sphingopyxis sp. J-6]|uniref:sterol desaturase family protein n=1 Tax=Sphingopyxis sp. J-6 TaxID=3122054 RepID=UPI0039841750
MIARIEGVATKIEAFFSSNANVYSPAYLAGALVIASLLWVARPKSEGLFTFLFPVHAYRHASTKVDAKLLIFNMLFLGLGFLPTIALAPIFAYGLSGLFPGPVHETGLLLGAVVAVLLIAGEDFGRYLCHYAHHKSEIFWPFHAVHHSAETLTPLTYMRAHPVYYLVQQVLMAALIGGVQALAIVVLVGKIEAWVYLAGSLVSTAYFIAGAHLRHSHIWLSYGPLVEHVLISPAQHQVHHSTAPQHRDRNFGEIFALWDWAFGTLYVTRGREELNFGLSDEAGTLLAQPHTSLRLALLKPFWESGSVLCRRLSLLRLRSANEPVRPMIGND